MLPPPAAPACRRVHGAGDCSDLSFCSGRGNCTDGLCVCPPGYIDAQCAVSLSCNFWSEELGAWSSEGVTTSLTAGAIVCSTTHLTTFGGILSIPTSVEQLLIELRSEFTFNSFSVDEGFSLLAHFDVADNPTIMSVVLAMAALNVVSVACLGGYRGYRMAKLRRRERRMTSNERMALQLRSTQRRLQLVQRQMNLAVEISGDGTPAVGSKPAALKARIRRGLAAGEMTARLRFRRNQRPEGHGCGRRATGPRGPRG